jgi:hypothetical protein
MGGVIVLGLAIGVAVNLKVSGPVYLLPALALLASTAGWRPAIAALTLAAIVGIAPFLLSNVSLTHYLQYIQVSARNGLLGLRFRQNLEWTAVLSAPLVVALWAARDRQTRPAPDLFLVSLAASMTVIVIIASKPGAGPYHLMPFVTMLAFGVLRLPAHVWEQRALRSLAAAVVLTLVFMAVPRQTTFIETVRNGHLDLSVDDLRMFADAHRSSRISVGYAGTSRFSDARTEIVFRSGEYWLDAPAVQEYRLAGLDLPDATIRAIRECRFDYWLIPSGGEPFVVPSAYWPEGPQDVFPDNFRQAFVESYEPTGRTLNFTVWSCKPKR